MKTTKIITVLCGLALAGVIVHKSSKQYHLMPIECSTTKNSRGTSKSKINSEENERSWIKDGRVIDNTAAICPVYI
ncbi:hypothetical protein EAI26_06385 [Lactobacillus sp. 0.1XD8-4]|uniref:hypothetical protein n=1 Tax=uncultured Limosilactobacillus sp. TaxID=2837629 RepID=UPI00129DB9D3|nr:hypothetical protein [uncultured Limosilactobacillus sp.]MRN07013.1 hypothetical protein [Lactobacillus sp. 0.1XD8-4]